MKLRKKTLVYSGIIAVLISLLFSVYLIFLLPGLYVDHIENKNINMVRKQLDAVKNKKTVKGDEELFLIYGEMTIPKTGYKVQVGIPAFSVEVEVLGSKERKLLDQIREVFFESKEWDEDIFKQNGIDYDFSFSELFGNIEQLTKNFKITVSNTDPDISKKYEEAYTISQEFYSISNNEFIGSFHADDGKNHYVNYIGLLKLEDSIYLYALPSDFPSINSVIDTVIKSLPMIIGVILILVFFLSYQFSNRIVKPIEYISTQYELSQDDDFSKLEPIHMDGHDHDEIGQLVKNYNVLHSKLKEQYDRLDKKNKQQEIFLKASSHQMKTPIAAALLLVEGMMDKIGKYKDVPRYLGQVKKELKGMEKIVQELLFFQKDSMKASANADIQMEEFLKQLLSVYTVSLESKKIHCETDITPEIIATDVLQLERVIRSLMDNAIAYTKGGGNIRLSYKNKELIIENQPAFISEDILEHIYEPFVTSNDVSAGHGLGLYLVKFYENILNYKVEIKNTETGIRVSLQFE